MNASAPTQGRPSLEEWPYQDKFMCVPMGMDWGGIPLWIVWWTATKERAKHGGVATEAYLCPTGHPTIGIGETDCVQMGDTCTVQEGWEMFRKALLFRRTRILAMCKIEPNENQFAALLSFAYNVGLGGGPKGSKPGLKESSVLRLHNSGKFAQAAKAFLAWNKGRKTKDSPLVVIDGLHNRRLMEAAMYSKPVDDRFGESIAPMAQDVAPERTPLESKTVVTAGGGLVVAAVPAAVDTMKGWFGPVKEVIETLEAGAAPLVKYLPGDGQDWLMALMALALAYVVYQKVRDMRDGQT